MVKPQPYRRQQQLVYLLLTTVIILVIAQVLTWRELSRRTPLPEAAAERIEAEETKAILAIIIDDFGYRQDAVTEGFLDLEARLTYSILPGHEFSQSFGTQAAQRGYEVIVHMPMEANHPTRGEKEYRLVTAMTSAEIESCVRKVLDHIPAAVGMSNHQGSRATTDARMMNVLAASLLRDGKYFVDSRTTPETIAEETMRSRGVPTLRRHVFLDNDPDPDLIRLQLNELAQRARREGVALGVGHARPTTLAVLQDLIPQFQEQGFRFEYVSSVVN